MALLNQLLQVHHQKTKMRGHFMIRYAPSICLSQRSINTTIKNTASWISERRPYDPSIQENKHGKLFDKILVANRGEIACRVIKTAKKMGIKTVAIYSEADATSKHVDMADEAVCVGPPPTSKSYLKIDRIVDAIKKTGAQAVHPGYGFLSENQTFAAKLQELEVTFIGPSSYSIHAMGDKIESKRIAKKAGVPTIPGYDGVIEHSDQAIRIAQDVGYPVMIKASAGGGGKGMRIAWNDEEVKEGIRFASQEAKSSFGDDRLLIEKFIDHPRHIEIQLIGDKFGNTFYLPERECSIQRRNQKVIEEAPSTHLDPATRKAMGEQAVALAQSVGYFSAGTVEFLVDPDRHFYFLEMNTRLQVEHPITEYITGLDLVELMIRVAANQKLSLCQENIDIHGWAIESRVYAEDPTRFLPSVGRLSTYIEPDTSRGNLRVDSGIVEGSEISVYYDPLIAKLISYGHNRLEAIDMMKEALDTYVIKGVTHNIPILYDVFSHPRFISGNLSTKFLNEEYPKGFEHRKVSDSELEELCAAATFAYIQHELDFSMDGKQPSSSVSIDTMMNDHLSVIVHEHDYDVHVTINPETKNRRLVLIINGKEMYIDGVWHVDVPLMNLSINGRPVTIQYMKKYPLGCMLQYHGTSFDISVMTVTQRVLSKYMLSKPKADMSRWIMSPMPGTVLSINVQTGDMVIQGQEIAVVEAMKMQNILKAPRTGKVKSVHAKSGTNVATEGIILEFEPEHVNVTHP